MSSFSLNQERSVLVLVDLQPKFMNAIHEADRVLGRSLFLAKVAQLLEIPVLVTEQYPTRMGGTDESLLPLISDPIAKMEFSAGKNPEFLARLATLNRDQIIVIGIETHICISQTCVDLRDLGKEVFVCPDATSSRTQDRHKLGMERLRDSGIMPIHTEAVAYEWMGSADHPKFRQMLELVKSAPY